MTRIIQLDPQTANSIAAGEVVERPASVVKELVENALDAGASVVSVEIVQGGVRSIRITDNGCGMDAQDARLAFGRHTTSKLRHIEDLDRLLTMGFRGEALASIAAVSRVTLETREAESAAGTRLVIEAGQLLEQAAIGCAEGTSILVENLFANVPARFKFLRKDSTEAGHTAEMVERIALARPDVSFRLTHNGQTLLHTPGNNDLTSAVYAVYGKQAAQACLPLEAREESLQLSGLVGRPEEARNNRGQQNFYVNGRPVRSRVLSAALDEAYKTRLMKGRYAIAILFLTMPAQLVDVNVHPQKLEVRFWNDSQVFRFFYHAIQNALLSGGGIAADNTITDAEEDTDKVNETLRGEDKNEATAPVQPLSQPELPFAEPAVAYTEPVPASAGQAVTGHPASICDEENEVSSGSEETVTSPPDRLQIDVLARARLIGTLFGTYILLDAADELLLVDQHAAHEKVLFERLVARHRTVLASGELLVQDLLVPEVITLSRRDLQTLQDEADQLRQLGFDCSVIGPAGVALRSIPDTGERQLQPEAALRMALNAIQQDQLKAADGIKEVFYQMACKAAVKAHDRLGEAEIRQLLHDLQRLEDPYHCPHGRPVVVRLSRRELEKRFRRVL